MKRNRGIIQLVIIILIAILTLSYFGIDLEQAATKPLFKRNLEFTWKVVVHVWNNYIYDPLTGLFKKEAGGTPNDLDSTGDLIVK